MLVRATQRQKSEVDPVRERAVHVAYVAVIDCTICESPSDILEYPLVATERRLRRADARKRDPEKGWQRQNEWN
jgi:hypothetical protein